MMHMYPLATRLSSHTWTPWKTSVLDPIPHLLKWVIDWPYCYLHFSPKKMCTSFVLELRQTNLPKAIQSRFKTKNFKRILVMEAKYPLKPFPAACFQVTLHCGYSLG